MDSGYLYGAIINGKFVEWKLGSFIRVEAIYCLKNKKVYKI
jgi:hypothetical protein